MKKTNEQPFEGMLVRASEQTISERAGRVLVLGGTGYLGSRIVRALLKKEYAVVLFDKRNRRRRTEIKDIFDKSNSIKVVKDLDSLGIIMRSERLDCLLNMVGHYEKKEEDNQQCLEANFYYPASIIEMAIQNNVKQILSIGTGLPNEFNMYSFTKSLLDLYGRFVSEKRKVNFTTLKVQMFYGEDEPEDRLISRVIRNCLNDISFDATMGTQKRDIIAMSDLVRAVLFLIEKRPPCYQEISVGTGDSPTIREIMEFIQRETKSKSYINFGGIPMRDNEPDCVADMSVLNKMGFECEYRWKDGIRKMIYEIKKEYSGSEVSNNAGGLDG